MLSVVHADCHLWSVTKDLFAECHYVECCYAECHYAECHYAECRGPSFKGKRGRFVECFTLPNFMMNKISVAKSELVKLFLWFLKSNFAEFCYFLILANTFLGRVKFSTVWEAFWEKEGGMQVYEGLSPYTQILGSLLRTPWLAKPTRKKSANVGSAISLQWENTFIYFSLNEVGKV